MNTPPTVTDILQRWPDRASVHEDALAADPQLDMIAVHRWFQRGAVPGKYWGALLRGATGRGVPLSAEEIIAAHSVHAVGSSNGPSRQREVS